jgi:hypothetical protein
MATVLDQEKTGETAALPQAGQQFTFPFARRCRHSRTTLRLRPMHHGGLHLGERCADYSRWLRWGTHRTLAPRRLGR